MLDISGDVGGRARRAEGSGHADDESVTVDIHLMSKIDLVAGVTLLQNVEVRENIADADEGCGRGVEGATGDGSAESGGGPGSEPGQGTEGGAEGHLDLMCVRVCTGACGL